MLQRQRRSLEVFASSWILLSHHRHSCAAFRTTTKRSIATSFLTPWQQQRNSESFLPLSLSSSLHLSQQPRFLTKRASSASSSSTTVNMAPKIPSPPLQYNAALLNSARCAVDMEQLHARSLRTEQVKQAAFDLSRSIHVAIVNAKQACEDAAMAADDAAAQAAQTAACHHLQDLMKQACTTECMKSILHSPPPPSVSAQEESSTVMTPDAAATTTDSSPSLLRTPRLANLSMRMEEYIRFLAFRHFLTTGTLMAPSAVLSTGNNNTNSNAITATDEEYLAAIMGLCNDLERYGLGRATVRDVESVQIAADLVDQIHDWLLQFDFRNGPLRRKYDGTKYALRTLETILYELAVTGSSSAAKEDTTKTTPAESSSSSTLSRVKQEKEILIPSADELDALRLRLEHRDELRETLIKKCRDGQKAAKQAIFSLHRGDTTRAISLLKQCHDCIHTDLLPIVQEEPFLRHGSFAGVLEEYVEAKLFAVWLYGTDVVADTAAGSSTDNISSSSCKLDVPACVVLRIQEFDLELDPEEYLGGLSDLSGEIGRFAVKQGTARKVENVKLCLQTNQNIVTSVGLLERLPNSIMKKMDATKRSVEKLERMLYEMSLSEAAGGRNVHSDVATGAEAMDDDRDNNER